MTITEELDQIDKLVVERADPAKIRGHIQAIRDQLEAHAQEIQKAPNYIEQIAALTAEKEKLISENARLLQQPKPSISTNRSPQFRRDQQEGI
jgi:hypothetical protein